MKTYLKPEAEWLELQLNEAIMDGELDSTEWGVEGDDGYDD